MMLPGKPVFLLTDLLIFVLVASIVSFFAYAMRKPHLRQPWGQVVRARAGVISMIVLSVYVAIALLDSLHFHPVLENPAAHSEEAQYSGEVISVFDQLVSDLRASTE